MAIEVLYTAGALSVAQIEEIYRHCERLKKFSGYSFDLWQEADLKWKAESQPPAFLRQCECKWLAWYGIIPHKSQFWSILSEILGWQEVAEVGALNVRVYFGLPGGARKLRESEKVSLSSGERGLEFAFETALQETDERKLRLLQVRDAAELPLEIVDTERGFDVRHASGGVVFASRGRGPGIDASFVRCSIRNLAVNDGIEKMQRVLEALSGEVLKVEWYALSGATLEPEPNTKLLRLLLDKNLPASRNELNIVYRLPDWRAIEQLRLSCGLKDRFDTDLCSFEVDGEQCVVSVVTTVAGHELIVELEDAATEGSVQKLLGVELEMTERR